MTVATLNEAELSRARILLGEASSSITQCTNLLGEPTTNQILHILDGVAQEIIDRSEAIREARNGNP